MKDRIKGDGSGDKRGEGEWKERRKLAGYESCNILYLWGRERKYNIFWLLFYLLVKLNLDYSM